MQDFLKEYTGDMIMVTHSRDEAFRFCRNLMLLKEGKTLIFGDTRKLFEQPELLEAARLTGCKNHSRIERLGDHELFALDWGVALRTEKKNRIRHHSCGNPRTLDAGNGSQNRKLYFVSGSGLCGNDL